MIKLVYYFLAIAYTFFGLKYHGLVFSYNMYKTIILYNRLMLTLNITQR